MNDQERNENAFEAISQANRVGRTARMLETDATLKPNMRTDIIERCRRFMEEAGYTQKRISHEIGCKANTISEVLRQTYKGETSDSWLVKIHNWMELAARRHALVKSREFVQTSVAAEILQVAAIVAETCQMGVVFGPARIGKTFTLQAIEGDHAFGDPVLIRIDESTVRPLPLCRAMCARFELSPNGTFDTVFRRIVTRLADTKRMLIFDEADRVCYRSLETIRDLHDATGCPVLLSGKPRIYEHLGLRNQGEFHERLDQLAGRIAIKRDLTERTRGEGGAPLFSLEDVRKMIRQSGLAIKVSPDAVKWLRSRASTLGMGGIGRAMVSLYLAAKVAYAKGADSVTTDYLEDVDGLAMGQEDAGRLAEVVAASSGMKRVV